MNDQYYYVNTASGTVTVTLPNVYVSNTGAANANTFTIPSTPVTYIIPNIIYTHGGGYIGCGSSGDFALPTANTTAKKKDAGCSCAKCRDFNEYAEPNQQDGSFICYACRKGC